VALLRGLNVGGRNRLPMSELVALFEEAGAGEVRTYIQSGNVLFTATAPEALRAAARVSKRVEERFGFRTLVIVRSGVELETVARENPFVPGGEDPSRLHVAFLADRPAADGAASLDRDRSPPDSFALNGREIYLCLPNGMARTRLTNDYLDRALSTTCTIRNWRTVLALVRLAGA
jgi:uncharacterized protein (DUF1697 family)